MSQTYSEFKADVQLLVFPEGMPEQFEFWFNQCVLSGLIDTQRWLKYYQNKNRDVTPFCATYFSCGATVIDKPRGRIQRVYTLEGDCCPVFYDEMPDYDEFMNWLGSHRKTWTVPANVGMPPLPSGFKFSEPSLNKGYRFNYGYYCLHNERIYLAQRIESTESVVVEWNGIRRRYVDTDLMPYDDPDEGDASDMGVELRSLIESWVRAEHLRVHERSPDWAQERQVYNDKRADLKYEEKMENRVKPQRERKYDQLDVIGTPSSGCPTTAEREAVVSNDTSRVAFISDAHVAGNANQSAVAALVRSWNPEIVFCNGDMFRSDNSSTTDRSALVDPVMDLYGDFIPDLFSTSPGNHDRDPAGRYPIFRSLFWPDPVQRPSGLIPNPGYFSRKHKFIEVFHLDTGYDNSQVNQNPDGVGISSRQAGWLMAAMAASTAKFKLVSMHHPAWTSFESATLGPTVSNDGRLMYPALRLPFKQWGADAVLFGHVHAYEHLVVDGIPYLGIGTAGGNLVGATTMDNPIAQSVNIITGVFGALDCVATCTKLDMKFTDVSGAVRETISINKP